MIYLHVRSRTIAWHFYEKFRFFCVPSFHGLDGRDMSQGFLGNVVIVQPDVAMNRCLQRFAAVEAMGGEYLADAPVNSRTTASRSSRGSIKVLRSSTTTAS